MADILTGEDKLKKICDALKNQTIEPAKAKAKEIVDEAQIKAKEIIAKAEDRAKNLLSDADREIKKKESLSLSSVQSAARQTIDKLKQEILEFFFKKNLKELVVDGMKKEKVVADLITVVMEAIQKEGINSQLSAYIPKAIKPEVINKMLAKDILDKLEEKTVLNANFSGGAKIKLIANQMTLDISDEALTELISNFIRKDFREMIFNM